MIRAKKVLAAALAAGLLLCGCGAEGEEVIEPVVPNVEEATEYMDSVEIEVEVPTSYTFMRTGEEYGEIVEATYYSTTCEKDRPVNIVLPVGYDEDKSYPVLYVLHGIFCDQTTMMNSNSTHIVIQNMIKDGLAKDMIIVFPYIYASKEHDTCAEISVETSAEYDNFLNDLVTDLMPYMAENYAVAQGKKNTAVLGFSMGGREALAIGFTYPDLFGYVGAIAPAPGLVPGQDWAMTHPGQFQNDELVFSDDIMPWLLMICCGDNDHTVGTFPKTYHEILDTNGVDHIWYEIPGSDHGDPAVLSGTYNCCKYAFGYESTAAEEPAE